MNEHRGVADALPSDYDELSQTLAALAYPMRLELLGLLRWPQALADIRIAPRRGEKGGDPARAAAKQTVHTHLEKLIDAGLVRAEPTEPGARQGVVYSVVPQALYAAIEDLRRLSTMHAGLGRGQDETGTLAAAPASPRVAGPRLVLVHGVYEGKSFALSAKTAQAGAWTIGRTRGHAVTLDYDPFVSVENATLVQEEARIAIRDAGSKNGTFVNWDRLREGESRILSSGDVVGVGRSMLVFRGE